MPEEQTTQIDSNNGNGAAAATEGQTDTKENKQDNQNPAIFSQGYNSGLEKGLERGKKEFTDKLTELFGTSDIDKLSEISQKVQQPAKTEVPPEITKKLEILSQENQKLQNEIEQNRINQIKINNKNKIASAVNRLNPISPQAADMVTDSIFNQFEIKDNGKIFKKGEEIPYFIGNEMATLDGIVNQMKENELNFAFKKTSGFEHINEGNFKSGITNYKVDPAVDFYKAGFKDAIKKSGQFELVKEGKPIDLTKLPVDWKQFNINLS